MGTPMCFGARAAVDGEGLKRRGLRAGELQPPAVGSEQKVHCVGMGLSSSAHRRVAAQCQMCLAQLQKSLRSGLGLVGAQQT